MKKYLIAFAFVMTSAICLANDFEDYFKEFLYQVHVDDTDPENPITQSRYVMAFPKTQLPLANGDSISMRLSLFLLKDNQFVVYYNEMRHPQGNPNQFYPNGCKKISGTWSVPEQKLLLPGVGYAERTQIDAQQGMIIHLTEKLISDVTVNFEMQASYGFSNMTLEQQFCW
jgi:hypothetical protein